ncbi:Conserved_hypothetical protein [Hexamita inflata]|uniref:Transmembrane protein n=1 Tax=Hexamita inflata TaxID=28002 RepID=A0AA86PX67_9EUKA|nr:Conserved hypothetical protein [Hexamita inflata]
MQFILQTLQTNIECFDRYAKLTIFVRNNTLLAQINRSSAQDICNSVFAQEATLQVNVGGMVYSTVLQMSQTESQFLIPITIPGGDMTTVQTLKQANYQITFGQQFTFSGTFQKMNVDLVDSRECWSMVTMDYVKDYELTFALTPNTCTIVSNVQMFLESSLNGQTWTSIFIRNISGFVLSMFTSTTLDSSLLDANTSTHITQFIAGFKLNFQTLIRLKLVEIDPDFQQVYFANVQAISNPISLSKLPLPVATLTNAYIYSNFKTINVYNYFHTLFPTTTQIVGYIVIFENGQYKIQQKFQISKTALTTRNGFQYIFESPILINSSCNYTYFQIIEGVDANGLTQSTLTSTSVIWLSCIKHMELEISKQEVCMQVLLYDNVLCRAAYPTTFTSNFNLLADPDTSDPTKRTTYTWINYTHPIGNVFSKMEMWCFDSTYEINKVQGVAAGGTFTSRLQQFFEVYKHSQFLSVSRNNVEYYNIDIITSVNMFKSNTVMYGTIGGLALIISISIIVALAQIRQHTTE